MNWRWYITGLIIALAFYSVSMEQAAVPNQEIVVQFNTSSVSEVEVKRAITDITFQLKSIGVEDVKISEIRNGKLKVSYYSIKNVATIKNLLEAQADFQLGDTAFHDTDNSSGLPSKENPHTYKVEVVTIKADATIDVGLHGVPFELKLAKEQFVNPIVSLGASETQLHLKTAGESVAYKNYRTISLLLDISSYKIPEVRAGPLS